MTNTRKENGLQSELQIKKSEFRNSAKKTRAGIKEEQKSFFDKQICDSLISLEEFRQCSSLLAYYPVGSEINIIPVIAEAWKCGKRVAFPVCTGKGEMIFRYCDTLECLVDGAYSIPTPPSDCEACSPDENTMCIVPALATDGDGYRMGYGGGYYDRFLEQNSVKKVCAIYSSLIFDNIPHDEHDIRADITVSERGVFKHAYEQIQ